MRRLPSAFLSLCLISLLALSVASGASTIEPQDKSFRLFLADHVYLFDDKSTKKNWQEIYQIAQQRQLKKNDIESMQFGYRKSALWFVAEIQNPGSERISNVLDLRYAPLDYIEIYLVDQTGKLTLFKELGDHLPYDVRDLKTRSHTAALTFEPNSNYHLLIRLKSSSTMAAAMYLSSPDAMYEDELFELVVMGMFYGLAFGLFFYNLFLFLLIKDKVYLFYIIYVLSYTLFMASLDGLLYQFWPQEPVWENRSLYLFPWVCGMFLSLFCRNVLLTKTESPTSDLLLRLFFAAYLIGTISFFIIDLNILSRITPPVIASNAFVILGITFVRFMQGFRAAFYFVIGMGSFCFGVISVATGAMNMHDAYGITPYIFKAGAAIEMIMFSVALAQRITTLEAENLKRMDKLKDNFLANTSHELRTPLNGIIGLADSMLQDQNAHLGQKEKRNLELISSSGYRLSGLVNDILDFSRLKQKDIVINKKPVNLRYMADSVLELSNPLVHGKNIKLINKIDANLPAVNADEDRIYQVLHNLVANAIKFTDFGSISLDAEIRSGQMIVSVTDTGIGVDKRDYRNIFQAFEQLDASGNRQFGGTGLGLAITKQLINLHNGDVWLDSVPGRGSRFYFSLPDVLHDVKTEEVQGSQSLPDTVTNISKMNLARGLASKATEAEQETGDSSSSPQEKPSKQERYRILVVDDEPINIEVLKNLLATENYHLTPATGGTEALKLVEQNESFDLILLDVMMPQMSGYEVCTRLRKQFSEEQLPILMLTAKNQIEDLLKGFRSGANDYLAKPFIKDELLARVKLNLKVRDSVQAIDQKVKERTQALEHLNTQLEQAKQIAEVAQKDLSEFSTMFGHELRTPISIMQCEIELLVEGVREPSESNLKSLQEEVDHLNHLVNDIFELILSDAKSLNYLKEPTQLVSIIARSCELFKPQFNQKDIELSFSTEGCDSAIIFADAKRIKQVIDNILKNSLNYTDPKGQANVYCEITDNWIWIHCEDSAPGANEQHLDQLFDRFYRMEKSRNRATGGTGLGLSICKAIIEDHQGRISASPGKLGGLLISFGLPLYQEQ